MSPRRSPWLAIGGAILIATVLACGGGGGGGGTDGGGSGGSGGNVSNLRAAAVLGGDNRVVVPVNAIQRGDAIRFVIVGNRDSDGLVVTVPASEWGLTPTNVGTINPSTGAFTGTRNQDGAIATGITSTSVSRGLTFNVVNPGDVGTGLQIVFTFPGGQIADPENIMVGDEVTVSLAGVGLNGEVVRPTSGSWSTTAPSSVATVSGSTVRAVGPSGSDFYVIRTNAFGRTHETQLQVRPAQAAVTGRVRTTSGTRIGGVRVMFYNGSGSEVGRATTAPDGTFRASVPTSAVRFHIDLDGVDPLQTAYFRQYGYGPLDYAVSIPTCTAPLPSLTNGVTRALPNDIVLYRQGPGVLPPPPPDGCMG